MAKITRDSESSGVEAPTTGPGGALPRRSSPSRPAAADADLQSVGHAVARPRVAEAFIASWSGEGLVVRVQQEPRGIEDAAVA